MHKPITKVTLIKGGNIIKQGHDFALEFNLFDGEGNLVDLTDSAVTYKIAQRSGGVVHEGTAQILGEGRIAISVTEDVGYGDRMRVEFTATTNGKATKFPADDFVRLKITPSLDNLGYTDVNTITVEQLVKRLDDVSAYATEQADRAKVYSDNIDAVMKDGPVQTVNGKTGTITGLAEQAEVNEIKSQLAETATDVIGLKLNKKPALIDQYVSHFYNRGQIATELPTQRTVTEQNITANAPAGSGGVSIADPSKYELGSIVVIKYDDDTYSTHFVRSKTVSTISFSPTINKAVTTNSKIERAWYDSAHPGKFYMRFLAQKLANATETSNGYGENVFHATFNGTSKDDVASPVGTASIGYQTPINIAGTYQSVLERSVGKTLFFTTSLLGHGVKSVEFTVNKGERLVLRLFAMSRNAENVTRIGIKTAAGVTVVSKDITGGSAQIMNQYELEFTAPFNADRLYVDVTNQTAGLPVNAVFLGDVRVMRGVEKDTHLLPRTGTILGLGDSWTAGDPITSPERESFLIHLQKLLPKSEIINKGVGGNKVQDLLARFDVDVVPFKPDAVVINVGTNDSYSPSSGTFDPNSIDYYVGRLNELVQKCIDIGAKPVVIAPPALAEETGSHTGYILNDRSRAYNNRLYSEFFKNDYGNPSVKNTNNYQLGKYETTGTVLTSAFNKDVIVTVKNEPIKIKRVGILAGAFNDATSSDVTLKIYNSDRTTLIATSEVVRIEKDSEIHERKFILPITTLKANTGYIFAFESAGYWRAVKGGVSTSNNYGKFSVDNITAGNAVPPATTMNDWISLLLIPPSGLQKVFLLGVPTRYSTSPPLHAIDEDSTINVFDDKGRLLLSYYARLGEEFAFEQ